MLTHSEQKPPGDLRHAIAFGAFPPPRKPQLLRRGGYATSLGGRPASMLAFQGKRMTDVFQVINKYTNDPSIREKLISISASIYENPMSRSEFDVLSKEALVECEHSVNW